MGTIETSFIPRTTDISEETKTFIDKAREETDMPKLRHGKYVDWMNIDADPYWRSEYICDGIEFGKIISDYYDEVTTFRLKVRHK